MSVHIRKKDCVICGRKWEIEWEDGESFRENIQCPICTAETIAKIRQEGQAMASHPQEVDQRESP